MAIIFAVDVVVRLVGASDWNSAVSCSTYMFFYEMSFAVYNAFYCLPTELDDMSELIAVAALVVEAEVVVAAEFADFVEDR